MNQTRRSFVKTAAATAGLAGVSAGVAGADGTAETIEFTEDFDSLSASWQVGADLENSWFPGFWDASLVSTGFDGSSMIEFAVDGAATPGMVWIYAPIDVEAGTAYEGSVDLSLHCPFTTAESTRLHVCLGSEMPGERDAFPDSFESWRLQGDRLGMNVSLEDSTGWNDYSSSWVSPELDTDTLYLAVGISTDSFVTSFYYLDSIEVELTPADAGESEDVVQDVSLEAFEAGVNRQVEFDDVTETVTVRDTIAAPTPCHELSVSNTEYDATSGGLDIDLALEDADGFCSQVVEEVGYELTVDCTTLPDSITVATQGNETVTATRDPTLVGSNLYAGEEATQIDDVGDDAEELAPGIHYDPSEKVVHVVDEVTLTSSCEHPVVEDVTVDGERLTVDVEIDDTDSSCALPVADVPIRVEADFADGLPGVVDYLAPGE